MPQDLRLAGALLINAFLLDASYRLARRVDPMGDRLGRAGDALLLTLLAQYAAVCLPGLAGLLTPGSVTLTATALGAAMWWGGASAAPRTSHALNLRVVACIVFIAGFVAAVVYHQRYLPVTSNDGLGYHLPVAVHWMQTEWLSLHQMWFWTQANTYSPLGGSVLAAWWMMLCGDDSLARWVQLPSLALVFLGLVQVCRTLGATTLASAMIAGAAVLSRPLLSQGVLVKDDVIAAGFFTAAVAALESARLASRAGPWRLGAAMGMLLATKYTAVLALPALLCGVDAAWRARWGWRQWLILFGVTAALAGPWYLRNALLTGNPLYPVLVRIGDFTLLPGLLVSAPPEAMRSWRGAWSMLTSSYHGLQVPLVGMLGAAWLAAVAMNLHRAAREPVARVCTLGLAVGALVFWRLLTAAELRYAFPLLVLAFGCAALATRGLAPPVQAAWGTLLLLTSVTTSFQRDYLADVARFATTGAVVAGAVVGLVLLQRRRLRLRRPALVAGAVAVVVVGAMIYGFWRPYLAECRYAADVVWLDGYREQAEVWQFVRDHLPADATVAVSNAPMTYPMVWPDFRRRLVYAPVRPGLRFIHQLEPVIQPMYVDDAAKLIARQAGVGADAATWVENLDALGARHIVVMKHEMIVDPPEVGLAQQSSSRFRLLFENGAGVVYEVVPSVP
ncbi:MAG: hypothetical protein ACREIT_03440 [Tepidisphaeraceae bacterium]